MDEIEILSPIGSLNRRPNRNKKISCKKTRVLQKLNLTASDHFQSNDPSHDIFERRVGVLSTSRTTDIDVLDSNRLEVTCSRHDTRVLTPSSSHAPSNCSPKNEVNFSLYRTKRSKTDSSLHKHLLHFYSFLFHFLFHFLSHLTTEKTFPRGGRGSPLALVWWAVLFFSLCGLCAANSPPRFVVQGGNEIVVNRKEGSHTPIGE